jgi:superfamily II DNA or RNA helicase
MISELRPYQVEALANIRNSIRGGVKRLVVQAATGAGKCLGIGTPVLKFDGQIVPVESIVAGDRLMGPDSKPRNVVGVCRDRGPLFRIVPTKGDQWVCNDVHVLTLVESQSGQIVDVPLDEYLRTNKTFKHVHKLFSPECGIDFSPSNDPDVPGYFLGLWIGDGTKSLRGVSISKPDIEVRDECERVAVANRGTISTSSSGSCPTYHVVTPRGKPNRLLEKMRALMGRGDIPLSVLTASRQYRASVLAGVIDTDGYVAKGCCEVAQKSEMLASGITFLARSLGMKVTCADKIVNGAVYKRMMISGDFSNIPTRIARKTAGTRKQKKCATRTGFAVEPIGVGEYAGFELDGDGRFLLGDFTVTHNTKISAAIVEGCRSKNNRVAFVCPAISLIDQTVESFYAEGIRDIGVIQANHEMTDWSRPVQVCSIQTIQARGAFPQAQTVLFDECHKIHKSMIAWLQHPDWRNVPMIGLSATPWTKGLGKYFDSLLVAATTSELIEQGYLSPFKVFASGHPDLSNVKVVAGDYHEGQLSMAMQSGELTADIIKTWREKWGKGKTLCFGVDKAHAKSIQERFEYAGIRCGYQDSETTADERREIKRKFHNGEYAVVSNIQTLTTGVDWDVRCLILARPTRSEMLYTQIIGRALRTAPGKDCALILDHSDSSTKLGLVTDIHHDHLNGGKVQQKEKTKEKLPKECPQCHMIKKAKKCPNCGYEVVITSDIMEQDGELVEFSGGKKGKGKAREMTSDEKRTFLAELKCYCLQHGYKSGWAANKYKDRLKVWPHHSIADVPPAKMVSPTTALWIRARAIAFAKTKKIGVKAGTPRA